MLSSPDGPFINLARLDMAKYAAKPNLAKALFEYIFHHENDVRNVRMQHRTAVTMNEHMMIFGFSRIKMYHNVTHSRHPLM